MLTAGGRGVVEEDAGDVRLHFDGLKEAKEGMHSQLRSDGPPPPPRPTTRISFRTCSSRSSRAQKGQRLEAVIDRRRVCFFRPPLGFEFQTRERRQKGAKQRSGESHWAGWGDSRSITSAKSPKVSSDRTTQGPPGLTLPEKGVCKRR